MASQVADEWTISEANKAINISLLPPDSFVGTAKVTHTFNPLMTYQLFEGETIYGYKNLSVNLQFRQDDMSPALQVKYDERLQTDNEDVKVDDVEAELRNNLPEGIPTNLSLSASTFKPPGRLINEYKRDDRTFEIYRSDLTDPEARKLVANTQILLLFYIEAANTIDLDDDEWAVRRWDVFFLYERLPENQYSFIGYCTTHKYFFFSPSGSEKASAVTPFNLDSLPPFPDEFRARISQFLILPPYQKHRHGRQLYNVIVGEYLESDAVKEITVEDPSENFENLRDQADFTRLKNKNLIPAEKVETIMDGKKSTKGWIRTERRIAKMPLRQFMRMVEILLLEQILLTPLPKQSKLFARYQLYVKERLYRHNKDILMQIERDERSVKLQETYESVKQDYEETLTKLESPAMKGKGTTRQTFAGKRPASSITNIAEGDEEEEEELEPPTKRSRMAQ